MPKPNPWCQPTRDRVGSILANKAMRHTTRHTLSTGLLKKKKNITDWSETHIYLHFFKNKFLSAMHTKRFIGSKGMVGFRFPSFVQPEQH